MCDSVNKANEADTLEMAQELIDAGKRDNDFTKVMLGKQMRVFIAMKREHSADRKQLLSQIGQLNQQVATLSSEILGLKGEIARLKRGASPKSIKDYVMGHPYISLAMLLSVLGNLWSIGGSELFKFIVNILTAVK